MSYGADTDSRWGKSYDSVSARSYDNKEYARWLQADDDQWAEDYDDSQGHDADIYGKGLSLPLLLSSQPKKLVLRMECSVCKWKNQVPIKRTKHFELGGEKKRKGQMIQF